MSDLAVRSWRGARLDRHALRASGVGARAQARIVWACCAGSGASFSGHEPEAVPAYTADWSRAAAARALWRAALRHLRAKADGRGAPGDVLLFRMRDGGVAKHLGIAARSRCGATFIHAYSGHGGDRKPAERALAPPHRGAFCIS